MTDSEYISALKLLIDSAISVGRNWLWNDSDIMDTLTDEKGFGLTYGAVGWNERHSIGRQANKLADSRVRPI